MSFLPLNTCSGSKSLDVVLITGDAYVDHPSFGAAVIGRVLESHGYRVGIISMPDWRDPHSITTMGKPRLFFAVTSGTVDSMIARYTAFKMPRSDDPYVPGGRAGLKPERAVIVYCNLVKSMYKDVPIVIGGIEASMRRIAHYDFWNNKVRRSILEDSRADILVYGMGEKAICEIADRYAHCEPLDGIPGTVVIAKEKPKDALELQPEEQVMKSYSEFINFYTRFYENYYNILTQPLAHRHLIHYPPAQITQPELDAIYALPFQRRPHPDYWESIPAFEMIKNSVTAHRGCVSGCAFCSLALHQGKQIVSRNPESVLQEILIIARQPDFKGHITDIGGPSANNYGFTCRRHWKCSNKSCTFESLCPNLQISAQPWISLLERAAKIPGVTKVTIGSGIRYDLLMKDPEAEKWLNIILRSHTSGQLKIAPEHTEEQVLRAMHKTPLTDLEAFVAKFKKLASNLKVKLYPLPYLMSNHPGSNLKDMLKMKNKIKKHFGYIPEQVQAFIPLPMTISSVIYYTGVDPTTGEMFYVARTPDKRRQQHRVFLDSKKQDTS
jgi:uncharacterized radical SAM protein YgiQ